MNNKLIFALFLLIFLYQVHPERVQISKGLFATSKLYQQGLNISPYMPVDTLNWFLYFYFLFITFSYILLITYDEIWLIWWTIILFAYFYLSTHLFTIFLLSSTSTNFYSCNFNSNIWGLHFNYSTITCALSTISDGSEILGKISGVIQILVVTARIIKSNIVRT